MQDAQDPNTGNPPTALVTAIERILRPLVKLLLSYQLTYPQLIRMLKSTYVEVAEDQFKVNKKRQSDSRIHLLTGVHRKDVKRLRDETRQDQAAPPLVSAGAQIIGHWLGTGEYLDGLGKPRPLPLRPSATDGVSFESLVETVCKQDIRPRVILDEWIRLGIAHEENEHVVINTGAFTPDKGFDEKAFFFGKNTQDHINAASHNLRGLKPSYFDRSVYYDNLTESSVEELSELADSLGMQALTQMNKQALQRQNEDKNTAEASFRMNFGIFNFNSSSHDESE
ncbi:MAG: hypothetical protein CMQ15_03510 [Gammaproteobacteria bacterium]|nr:hypothetical protein [Gammaproteobacteria bacterium]|tara:strand:- start:21123 stop:21968 length:846 start_codon:yes stop_codon:yes gene_type:complete